MAHSAPAPQPIGIFPHFFTHQPETIVLETKGHLTSRTTSVNFTNGTPILQIQSKGESMSGRAKVFDMAGTHIFDMVKPNYHAYTTLAVENPKGQKVMKVKNSVLLLGGCKATATFTSQDGKAQSLQLKGSRWERKADIKDLSQGGMWPSSFPSSWIDFIYEHVFHSRGRVGDASNYLTYQSLSASCSYLKSIQEEGKVIARIAHTAPTMKDMFSTRRIYTMQLAPGVDMALMVAMSYAWTARLESM